ncbi:MAG TPA: EAL domain-containing protein [Caulobacterales bacterium]|nr:EAL domain-containing protein [Caulobacterales bacterium]
MFRRLRLKLTVLYAGLFFATLSLIGFSASAIIANNAQRMVRDELQATGTVFDRLWQLRSEHLQEGASISASDYGFRQAIASNDEPTIASALANLKRRLDADLVFLVTPQGAIISGEAAASAAAPPRLRLALGSQFDSDGAPTGVLMFAGAPHQAVVAPVLAPDLLGWVVVGERLDRREMQALEALSAIPLHASALVLTSRGWASLEEDLDANDQTELRGFIARALQASSQRPGVVHLSGGDAAALVKPFRSLDGVQSVLILRYPLAAAMAPYQPLFNSLFIIGLAAILLLGLGSWLLASGITKPISTLEAAARRLQSGEYQPVEVRTGDEIARLAEGFNAMAAAIQEREHRITRLALHDAETGLPNRLAVERRLQAGMGAGPRLHVAAVGVDRFAPVRGAIGYAHAETLMQRLGERIGALAQDAPMGRLSSDMLVVAFLAEDESAARRRLRKLQVALEQPVSIDGQLVDIAVSIGVARAKPKDDVPNRLIERASIGLDQARAARAKMAFFDEASYGDPTRNLSLMGDMRRALANGDMSLAHQPKLNMRTNTIDGVESLARWTHPRRGAIAPDLFVPMAEDTGHIRALTDWVLTRAIAEQRMLAQAGRVLPFSINISGRLLSDREFSQAAMRQVRAAAAPICFEITETAVIDNPEIALDNIDLFARSGVEISIDDYGSGLSSLAYLKQLPAHELKIDKVFIRNLANSQRDALLVRSTIDLAHGLGMKVTAEGVETPATFALLGTMGCDIAQGYLVGRPAPIDQLLTILLDAPRQSA